MEKQRETPDAAVGNARINGTPIDRHGTFSALASSPDILYHPKPEPSERQCLGLGELLGGAQAESTEIVSTGAGNPKASVARIKVAGRFPACETVSLLSEGRTRTNVGRRANDKKSFTAADLEEETDGDDDDDDDDEREPRRSAPRALARCRAALYYIAPHARRDPRTRA
ncbi:hypothetical protein ALC56_06555 [Trachymyrmex septentrionalis]|uniref:Uncharacterized protein n=1 Tax=Trachymyrmex septentrionalis TaxID=34720 RepID=A0A195FGJ5_9HYME|nr:hypothetical protein ALC56_06555 [Trachymyrmex septentrionalis]